MASSLNLRRLLSIAALGWARQWRTPWARVGTYIPARAELEHHVPYGHRDSLSGCVVLVEPPKPQGISDHRCHPQALRIKTHA